MTQNLESLMLDLQRLTRAEKLRLIRLLADDLENQETTSFSQEGISFPADSPHDSFAAAAELLKLLESERKKA